MKYPLLTSLRGRLVLGLALALIGFLSIGALGLIGTRVTYQSLESVYQDRVVPLRLLKDLTQAYGAQVEDAVLRMNSGEITAAEGIVIINNARDSIQTCWR